MTVKAYLEKLEAAGVKIPPVPPRPDFTLMEATEIWSNGACKGYFIEAAQTAGLDRDTIAKVLDAFNAVFDEISVDEAERTYYDY